MTFVPTIRDESDLKLQVSICANVYLAPFVNIARIANAVHCHSLLSGYKDCHELRFSIVIIVIDALVSQMSKVSKCR